MAEEEQAGEKTEEPSTRRREDAKKEGQVAKSHEISIAVTLLVLVGMFHYYFGYAIPKIENILAEGLNIEMNDAVDFGMAEAIKRLRFLILSSITLVLPVILFAFVLELIASFSQVGLSWNLGLLGFKWERLAPGKFFARLFSMDIFVQLLRSLLKALGIVAIAVYAAKDEIYQLRVLPFGTLSDLGEHLRTILLRSSERIGYFLGGLALLDYGWNRFQIEKKLRMTRQEMKDEFKEAEGNPELRAAMRKRARERSKRRLVDDVRQSTVIATNPTHYSVALRYRPDLDPSPRVLAKGADHRAFRIRELGRQFEIPVIEDKPLTRALFIAVKEGETVPVELFQGVARLIALVYQQQGKIGDEDRGS